MGQAVMQVPARNDGKRITARYFIEESRKLLDRFASTLPGRPELDQGGLNGLDPSTTQLAFGSTGRTEDDILAIYPPWVSTRWSERSKTCMVFCGIEPPQPQSFMEDYPVRWDLGSMRRGMVVFEQTPEGLETH